MGVKYLNSLMNKHRNSSAQNPSKYGALVIDGNNLVMTYLAAAAETHMPRGGNMSIAEQLEYILSDTYGRIINEFDRYVHTFGVKEIWMVFDPKWHATYPIDIDVFDLPDYDYFNDLAVKNGSHQFNLMCKDNEHKKRIGQKQSRRKTFADQKEKALFGLRDPLIYNNLTRTIQRLVRSIANSTNGGEFTEADENYLTKLYPMKEQYTLYYVQGTHTEADLIIKYVAETITSVSDDYVLVASKDTDYKILFCDNPSVYCTDINCKPASIMSPYITWRNIFSSIGLGHEDHLYEYIIRLAPLIGNDYTSGCATILNPTYDTEILKIFCPSLGINLHPNTNLYKFAAAYNYELSLDENIKNYDPRLYSAYIESVCVYKNWDKFSSDFEISKTRVPLDVCIKQFFDKFIVKEFGEAAGAKTADEFLDQFYEVIRSKNNYNGYFDNDDEDEESESSPALDSNGNIIIDVKDIVQRNNAGNGLVDGLGNNLPQLRDEFDGYFDE